MAANGAGAGRKKNLPEAHGKPSKYEALAIIESLGKPSPHGKKCRCFKCSWKRDAERDDMQGQNARKYLWDRYKGKPVDRVNHLHDKPMQVEVNVGLAETMQC